MEAADNRGFMHVALVNNFSVNLNTFNKRLLRSFNAFYEFVQNVYLYYSGFAISIWDDDGGRRHLGNLQAAGGVDYSNERSDVS